MTYLLVWSVFKRNVFTQYRQPEFLRSGAIYSKSLHYNRNDWSAACEYSPYTRCVSFMGSSWQIHELPDQFREYLAPNVGRICESSDPTWPLVQGQLSQVQRTPFTILIQ